MSPEAWAEVSVDDHLALVYGPRLGRLYLLPTSSSRDPIFRRVVGLADDARLDELADPVARIVHDLPSLADAPRQPIPPWPGLAYRSLSRSRRILPLRAAARLIRRLGAAGLGRIAPAKLSTSEIGRLVHAVEQQLGRSDCYPRALLTALIAGAAGRPCLLTVGVLAPTRKMHAWCSIDGELPYEPLPEHYLYQPLWRLALSP